MPTSVSARPAEAGPDRPPDWSPVPERRTGGSPRRSAIRRALIAAAVAGVIWLLGHPVPAMILIGVMLVVTALCDLRPPVAARLQRWEQTFQRWVGHGLSYVLLGLMQLLVFTPVALVMRVFRHDPLALGTRKDDPSFWRPRPIRRGRPLYDRPFAYERMPKTVSGWMRARAAVGLVALALIADVAVGALINELSDDESQRADDVYAPDVAAGRSEPWRLQLGEELRQVWEQRRYDPYLSWTTADIDGRHIHVRDGIRRSYQQPAAHAGSAPEVFFFGGSAMFGFVQRDEHTIPSELARLAEADGIRLRVVNYGRPAYVNWQEMLLLSSLVAGGRKPDLAVFYDGFNELVSQFQLDRHRRPTHLQADEVDARLGLGGAEQSGFLSEVYDEWADTSAVHELGRALGGDGDGDDAIQLDDLRSPWKGDQKDRPAQRGRYAAAIYGRGVDLIDGLAETSGFGARFFWQPSIYTKRVLPAERQLETWLAADPAAWKRATSAARARLAPAVDDLSDALDGVRSPVMYDFVHTNELGARAVAGAIYRQLKPQLAKLPGARSR